MAERLVGVRAVVTGGGRGIGAAIGRMFASEGAAVLVAARGRDGIESVVRDIEAAGGTAVAATVDITSDESVAALADAARVELGGTVNVLVNNAGWYLQKPFLDYTMTDWEQILAVNVLGTVRVTRAFLPEMVDAGVGRIINIASTAAKWGTANQSAYNVSKHGVLGLTRCLALETAQAGVRVNAICPGWVDTGLIDDMAPGQAQLLGIGEHEVREALGARAPIGRMTMPEEVAHLAVYLASPESDAMTGVGLTLAGGMILT